MSSVTKNPTILHSAQIVNSWFLSKIKTDEEMFNFNVYEEVQADKITLNYIENDLMVSKEYNKQDNRLARIESMRNDI